MKHMRKDLDVNPAFVKWRLSTGREKEWALQELIQKLEKFATAICWQRLPDHKNDFDPLVNGIIWRALKRIDAFRSEARFSTWFCRIVINECNRYLRNFKERCETELIEEMPADAAGLDARIDLIELLNTLQGADHTLFRMVAEGESFNAIGKTLGVSRGTAIVRWHRL